MDDENSSNFSSSNDEGIPKQKIIINGQSMDMDITNPQYLRAILLSQKIIIVNLVKPHSPIGNIYFYVKDSNNIIIPVGQSTVNFNIPEDIVLVNALADFFLEIGEICYEGITKSKCIVAFLYSSNPTSKREFYILDSDTRKITDRHYYIKNEYNDMFITNYPTGELIYNLQGSEVVSWEQGHSRSRQLTDDQEIDLFEILAALEDTKYRAHLYRTFKTDEKKVIKLDRHRKVFELRKQP